jgi:hypothetical protein
VVRSSWVIGIVHFSAFIGNREANSKMSHPRIREYVYFDLEPGDHKRLSKASTWSEIKVTASDVDGIIVEQEQDAFVTNRLLKLSIDAEKYRIKNADLGTIIKTEI